MILLDITTSFRFRHWRPMGILRVEREVLRALRGRFGADLVCALYDPETEAHYRFPEEMLVSLILEPAPQPPPPPRALTAVSPLRSAARIARFLWRSSRRCRAVGGVGPMTQRRRERILGEEMGRISLREYGALQLVLRAAGRVLPRFTDRLLLLNQINHSVHHGLCDTAFDRICTQENRIDPATVSRYVSVGGFWGDTRYRQAHQMRDRHGWTLHYLLYDLVPVLWRHVAEPTTRETFPLALHWLLWGVDQIWTISETTKADVLGHIEAYGYPELDPRRIRAIPLGSQIEAGGLDAGTERAWLADKGLTPGKFVLMVGTQEPRKNHDFAYRLWRELCARYPGEVVPLVWVGQPGWAIQPLLDMVRTDFGLPPEAIRIIPGVTDDELVSLYRTCRFTIYPSHYEGWGLPVVESLAFGKPCLTSTAPALTEAARGWNEAIGLFDGERWIARVIELIRDDAALAEAGRRLRGFSGDSWATFRETLVAEFLAFGAQAPSDPEPANLAGAPSVQDAPCVLRPAS